MVAFANSWFLCKFGGYPNCIVSEPVYLVRVAGFYPDGHRSWYIGGPDDWFPPRRPDRVLDQSQLGAGLADVDPAAPASVIPMVGNFCVGDGYLGHSDHADCNAVSNVKKVGLGKTRPEEWQRPTKTAASYNTTCLARQYR